MCSRRGRYCYSLLKLYSSGEQQVSKRTCWSAGTFNLSNTVIERELRKFGHLCLQILCVEANWNVCNTSPVFSSHGNQTISRRHQIIWSATNGVCFSLSLRYDYYLHLLLRSIVFIPFHSIMSHSIVGETIWIRWIFSRLFFWADLLWTNKTLSLGLSGHEEWGKPIKTFPRLDSNL